MTAETFRLEEATPASLGDLLAVERQGFDDPWSEQALAEELSRGGDLFLLVRDSQRDVLAGYACWRRTLEEAELLRVAIAPSYRRRGLALRLLRQGLERLQEAGARKCHLEVRPDNRGARALYRDLGFRKAGERPRYFRDGSPALLYTLDLAP